MNKTSNPEVVHTATVNPRPVAETHPRVAPVTPEIDPLQEKFENRKAANKIEEDRLRAIHKANEDALEARANPGKPVEEVIVGDVEWEGHSFVDGVPLSGTITVPPPGVTKQEVLRIAQSHARGPLSDEGFSFSVIDPKKESKK